MIDSLLLAGNGKRIYHGLLWIQILCIFCYKKLFITHLSKTKGTAYYYYIKKFYFYNINVTFLFRILPKDETFEIAVSQVRVAPSLIYCWQNERTRFKHGLCVLNGLSPTMRQWATFLCRFIRFVSPLAVNLFRKKKTFFGFYQTLCYSWVGIYVANGHWFYKMMECQWAQFSNIDTKSIKNTID